MAYQNRGGGQFNYNLQQQWPRNHMTWTRNAAEQSREQNSGYRANNLPRSFAWARGQQDQQGVWRNTNHGNHFRHRPRRNMTWSRRQSTQPYQRYGGYQNQHVRRGGYRADHFSQRPHGNITRRGHLVVHSCMSHSGNNTDHLWLLTCGSMTCAQNQTVQPCVRYSACCANHLSQPRQCCGVYPINHYGDYRANQFSQSARGNLNSSRPQHQQAPPRERSGVYRANQSSYWRRGNLTWSRPQYQEAQPRERNVDYRANQSSQQPYDSFTGSRHQYQAAPPRGRYGNYRANQFSQGPHGNLTWSRHQYQGVQPRENFINYRRNQFLQRGYFIPNRPRGAPSSVERDEHDADRLRRRDGAG